MDRLIKFLQVIYYLIWIPVGILLLAGIIFLIVANPLSGLTEALKGLGGAGGGFPSIPPAGGSGGFPSEEMMKQFMERGGPPGGQFGPPGQ